MTTEDLAQIREVIREELDARVAALCLHAQPFGFTQEMLRRQREIAELTDDQRARAAHAIADRIQFSDARADKISEILKKFLKTSPPK